jgi:hypothetical protein
MPFGAIFGVSAPPGLTSGSTLRVGVPRSTTPEHLLSSPSTPPLLHLVPFRPVHALGSPPGAAKTFVPKISRIVLCLNASTLAFGLSKRLLWQGHRRCRETKTSQTRQENPHTQDQASQPSFKVTVLGSKAHWRTSFLCACA